MRIAQTSLLACGLAFTHSYTIKNTFTSRRAPRTPLLGKHHERAVGSLKALETRDDLFFSEVEEEEIVSTANVTTSDAVVAENATAANMTVTDKPVEEVETEAVETEIKTEEVKTKIETAEVETEQVATAETVETPEAVEAVETVETTANVTTEETVIVENTVATEATEDVVETAKSDEIAVETTKIEEKDDAKAETAVLEAEAELSVEVAAVEEAAIVDAEAELAAEIAAQAMVDDTCETTDEGLPADEICVDEEAKVGFRNRLKGVIKNTLKSVRGTGDAVEGGEEEELEDLSGDALEKGWEERGNSSAIRRNAEVWKFALKSVFRVLKPKSLRKKGASEEEIKAAQIEAATYIRDGLLQLGPTFVKLGQVVSTRTDVLPTTYTDVLKTLQDEVPGFSGEKAKAIISKELGRPFDEIFTDLSDEPLKAASLGQVHTAYYKGQKVAIKVQRAGLKELFDVDLKNLKKLAELLDKFDPKTDGADRDWVSIYEESERLLYLEIDYLHEAGNAERFAEDFKDIDYVRVPKMYREVSTPKVLTMEFVDSFKLTDIERIEKLGLDRKALAKQTADAFLRQIVETSYFHCDPHPGNLCVDEKGNLVYYDFGMMDELKPNVRNGFRKFCTALFAGGPMINDIQLAKNAKTLVNGVEDAGVLARGADRLAVEKLARYFMRSFKDKQLGKKVGNIKETIGTDLQTLTENNVFRFPSTFTFIFRSFASVDGIGKKLDPDYDIGQLAQPFIEKFTESQQPQYDSPAGKAFSVFRKATGLNKEDINTAVTSPKKISYIEETLRSMEDGSLKIRVRSLENEKALERIALKQTQMENVMLASLLVSIASVASRRLFQGLGLAGAGFFVLQSVVASMKIKKFDKTQAKFEQTKFEGED